MSKILGSRALKREIPTVSGNIRTQGAGANIGAGLMDIANVAVGLAERKNTNQIAKASADMSVALIGESSALDQDPDYATHDKRFSGSVDEKLNEYAAGIANPNARNKFLESFKPKIALARERVKNKAWGKEQDFERGELITRLDTTRNAAITSGNIGEANENALALIQSHVDLGHIDADDAVKIRHSFRDDLSKGYIKSQAPEKRGELLKQPWAKKYLAPDDFASLKRDAEQELIAGKSQAQVDDYMAKEMSREDAMADIEKKYAKKPELRKAVEQRLDYDINKRDRGVEEARDELYEKYFLSVRSGKDSAGKRFTIDNVPREDLEGMSTEQQDNLFRAQANSVSKSKVPYNNSAEDNLNGLIRAREFQEARKFYRENSSSMSDAQNKKWSNVTIDGIDPENKSPFTVTQTINNKVPKYDKTRKGALNEKVTEWIYDYQEKEKKYPTDLEIDKEIDRKILEFGTTHWIWGSDPKPMFEMSEEEKTFVLDEAKDKDKKSFDDVKDHFKSLGVQPNHSQFMEVYKIISEDRRVK